MVNETWDRFGPAVRGKADNGAVLVGTDFLLLSTEKDYSIPHIMKVLAIVPKSEAAIWLEQFGNPE